MYWSSPERSLIVHDRAAAGRYIDLIWPATCGSGTPCRRGHRPARSATSYEYGLARAPYRPASAAIGLRRSGRKIWSMTSAPVVMTGRSSRR
jgi:hypothetical protein